MRNADCGVKEVVSDQFSVVSRVFSGDPKGSAEETPRVDCGTEYQSLERQRPVHQGDGRNAGWGPPGARRGGLGFEVAERGLNNQSWETLKGPPQGRPEDRFGGSRSSYAERTTSPLVGPAGSEIAHMLEIAWRISMLCYCDFPGRGGGEQRSALVPKSKNAPALLEVLRRGDMSPAAGDSNDASPGQPAQPAAPKVSTARGPGPPALVRTDQCDTRSARAPA